MKALRDYLKRHSMTVRAFSMIIGVDQSQISRYLNGISTPSLENAYKIQKGTNNKVKMEAWIC